MSATTIASLPALAQALPLVEDEIRALATSSTLPALNASAGRVTSAGGKRLRSVLVLSSALALTGEITAEVITAAACVELLHAGSLVHDDLVDGAARRRGVRTVDEEWGTGHAVLVGDFMLVRAGQAALEGISAHAAAKLAAATADLVEGQVLESLELFDAHRDPDSALRSIALKTGALFRVGCVLAAHCAEADEETATRLAEYGAHFGLLFQLLDDLLDLASTAQRLGRPVGEDIRQGVYTFPLLRALTPAQRTLLDERGSALTDAEVADLLAELRTGPLVPETLAYCANLAAQTVEALPALPEGEALGVLRELPAAYLAWATSQLTP
ncbi:polyprenyl synthetase family protein [Saccharothrix coeruleofusca]|uniref:Octaprenyl-diphosphate synthase n=1 Tax=Saccharothrix coeruleofusca TaxID=33919 RepID=A0A918ANH4_9PSEU|nr:polyprenyl synthetase family protein [Saccharothrix coeruleofusca]GGP61459.1 octaprenyl-diphosphate synthase [Saccharothrix coeruleofusca]